VTGRSAGAGIVLSADPPPAGVPYADLVVAETVRALWHEPRAPDPPGPSTHDWVLVGVAVTAAVVETIARPDLAWRPLSLAVVVAIAAALPWRRVHPLAVAALAFGTASAVDVVALARDVEWEGLGSAVFFLLLPYALTRWGSGRAVAAGSVLLAVPLALAAVRGDPVGDVVGGAVVLLLAAALGAGVRYQQASRQQELDVIRAREREQLARELHDTVAHHVSAIVVRAQAGRALADLRPGAAAEALDVIEEEASRTLEEMRSMVGALRDGARAGRAPLPSSRDIGRLARPADPAPAVEVEMDGDLGDLRPAVDTALYRLAQEAVTNAVRHARHARLVRVRVCGGPDDVRLTVDDDGHAAAGGTAAPGYGLVGMAERAKLLGGTFDAGARPGGGWTVTAVLPRHGVAP
jgi:signal transduction histidine kinase